MEQDLKKCRISEISAVGLAGATPEGGWADELKGTDCVHTIIFVHTSMGRDGGPMGVGSVFANVGLVNAAIERLKPRLKGTYLYLMQQTMEELRRSMFWEGDGAIAHTMSGIDIALWDAWGKLTGLSVAELLGGGNGRRRAMPYASLLFDTQSEHMLTKIQALSDRGFRAFKFGWGPFGRMGARKDEDLVRTVRNALGPERLFMVDAGASNADWPNGYAWALCTAHMLREYDVTWFEEPLPPHLIEDLILLRANSPVPIAGGETLVGRRAFMPFITRGALDIVQPDTTKGGGLSESRRIGWLAQDCGLKLIPHGWNTAVGLAADLQLAGTLADTNLVEYLRSPYVDDLVAGGWKIDQDGLLHIPRGPGLGIDLDASALERFSVKN